MSLFVAIEGSVRRSALVPLAPSEPCCHRVPHRLPGQYCSALQCVAVYCHGAPHRPPCQWCSVVEYITECVVLEGVVTVPPPRLPCKYPALTLLTHVCGIALGVHAQRHKCICQCVAVWYSVVQRFAVCVLSGLNVDTSVLQS